jgi:hypothetical protein
MPAGEKHYRLSKNEYYALCLALDGPPTEDQIGVLVNRCGVPRERAQFMPRPEMMSHLFRALGRLGARNRKARSRYRSRNRVEHPTRRHGVPGKAPGGPPERSSGPARPIDAPCG